MVGTARFELATPCTPCKCATRLRYVPHHHTLTQFQPVQQYNFSLCTARRRR